MEEKITHLNWGGLYGKEDMNLVKEFIEGGIFRYKIKTENRDALNKIKLMALNKEFDILIVYYSDCIGRFADETPLVIKFLNENGIKIWSISEGEITTRTHTDKLITYLRYWQNESESIKLSKRVTDYHINAAKDGRYRVGSMIPMGYKLVERGSKNHKGRNILNFEINEDEAGTD